MVEGRAVSLPGNHPTVSDIFICYSRKDTVQAEQLVEVLTSAGLSCWIDRKGIDLATNWSKEIVQAIDGCKAFVVLLSLSSIASRNVIKEVSLAAEQHKKILPLDLEPVKLPEDLRYHLAGIQRARITNIDAIIRALGQLGLETTAPVQPPKIVKESDGRKSLMILPFEDLSPSMDNEWFADGIVSELITALSKVKVLKIADHQATKEFKTYRGHLTAYAREMSVRYFVQGDVRKFGDSIKVTARLLDIELGEHLWQDSLRGKMEDIFDIQEAMAQKVVEGLMLHLSQDEQIELTKKPTDNADAYECYLKGLQYFDRATKNDHERALALYEEAVRIDPAFAAAYAEIAHSCQRIQRTYNPNPSLLDRAAEAAEKVRELEGESAQYFWVVSRNTLLRGDPEGALRLARRSIEIDPTFAMGYEALGFAYERLGNKEETVNAREEYVRLRQSDKVAQFGLLLALHELGDELRTVAAAKRAIPIFEQHARLNPDDYHNRVKLANILFFSGKRTEARLAADQITAIDSLDGGALYNLGCLYLLCNVPDRGMELLRIAVRKGYRDIEQFRSDPDLAPLRGTREFEELMAELEAGNA